MSSDAQSILGNNEKAATGIDAIMAGRKSVKVAANVDNTSERGKLRGLHKELYDLIGGRAPIAETTPTTAVKAKLGKAPCNKWEWRQFANPARKDGLKLSHWVKKDEAADKVYTFSKFNKLSRVPDYKRDDYLRLLADDDWSEEETNCLFELCRQFDLRFIVVHDHFKRKFPPGTGTPAYKARSVELLKARYYSVWTRLSKARNEVRKVRTSGVDVTYRYDAQHEAMRKEQLRLLMGRSIGQIHEENMLKADLKKIKAQDAQLERRASVPKRDAEDASGNPNKKLKKKTAPQGKHPDSAATRMFQTTHLRSARLEKPLQLRPKIAQKVADMCEELGVGESPLATGAVCSAYDTLLEVVTTVVNDQATTETKEAAVAQLKEKKARLEGKRQSRNRKR